MYSHSKMMFCCFFLRKVFISSFLVFFLCMNIYSHSEELDKDKIGKEAANLAFLWGSYNACWYDIEAEMTEFANDVFNVDLYLYEINMGILTKSERQQMALNSKKYSNLRKFKPNEFAYWENVTNIITAKFPNYDYSACEELIETDEDPVYDKWLRDNLWFGTNTVMTDFALQLHMNLVNNGIDPTIDSSEYYKEINKQMRTSFPEYSWE